MAIKTPKFLPGEKGYIPKKERTAARKSSEKRKKSVSRKKEMSIGKIKTGSKGFRIGRPTTTTQGGKKYPIWKFRRRIGEIYVSDKDSDNEGITVKFLRLGGIGNYKHLIQDADFQMQWAIREQELLMTQDRCYLCKKKISKTAVPNLYHYNMFQKRVVLLEKAEKVPAQVASGKLNIKQGWEKFNQILEGGNRYFMSLKDTALICATCAKSKGLKD
jgi:hypothetical protein